MTAALLEDDRIKCRCREFRRERSRQEFLDPLADCELEIADCPAPAAEAPPTEPTLPRSEPLRGNAPPPPSTVESPAAELLADPKVRQALAGKIPSHRNREIFRAVVVAHRSQREVAKEFGVSQPRVSQIIQQVARWLSENVVEQDRPRNGLAQIQLAENLVRMQYDHLYATALDLLHGRTSGSPASPAGEKEEPNQEPSQPPSQPPHKPNPAFLNAALRAVNSRAKFEGIIGRPLERATNEATWRRVSKYGPTNDGLQPDHPQNERPYNPLSPDDEFVDLKVSTAEEVSARFRKTYERFPAWFPGDFTARSAYYRTQTERVFDPPRDYLDADEREELEGDNVESIHHWDVMAALAHEGACEQSPPETSSQEEFVARRRWLLTELLKRDSSIRDDDDADGLLECLEYDEATGRFGWDLRFRAMAGL